LKSVENEQIIFVSVSLISVLAVMFHGFVDTIFFRPQIQFMFWTFVAVISTLVLNNKNLENEKTD
jgi:hypothetical protein